MDATNPNLLCVVGDTHAQHRRAIRIVDAAVEAGAGRVLQVGDFGWFPNQSWGRRFIAKLDAHCTAAGIPWYFIAGNHDDWDDLDRLTRDGTRDSDGAVIVGDALRYLPRPHRWQWSGVTFGALGGAWSIDHATRLLGVDLWLQEEPRLDDAVKLIDAGPLDVLVTHDAPGEVDLRPAARWGGNDRVGGKATRTLLDMVVARTTPKVLFHGHWHWRHTTRLSGGCRAEGLGDHSAALVKHHVFVDLADPGLEVRPTSTPLATRHPWWVP